MVVHLTIEQSRPRSRQASLLVICVAMIAVVAIGTVPAHAQDAGNRGAVEAAAQLNRRSNELYRRGRYGEAITLLREAYRLNTNPVLQYNLARSCERLGDYACAVEAYEIYLAGAEPSDRSSIEARLANCRARLAAARTITPDSASGQPLPRPPPVVRNDWLRERPSWPRRSPRTVLPLVVAAAGASGIAGGLSLTMVARSTHDAAVRDPSQTGAASKHERAESLMRAGSITLVAGGAVAAAGLLWWALDGASHRSGAPEPIRNTARIQVGAGYIALVGAF
jgi:tetratricopeptide (TPR) repeat protein